MNEILWIGFALVDLAVVIFAFRMFGKSGLMAMIVFSLLLCNIQVLKTVQLFGLTTTLGNVLYASIFLSTDLLSEFFGKKEAQKGVLLGFLALVAGTLYMQLALQFVPAADDFAQPHLQTIFGFMPRIALGSMAAYLISQWSDVTIFHKIREKTGESRLWLRNNVSTLTSQFLDSAIFCTIAFYGVFPLPVFMEIMLSTYVIKMLMGILDTPFIYLARRFAPQTA